MLFPGNCGHRITPFVRRILLSLSAFIPHPPLAPLSTRHRHTTPILIRRPVGPRSPIATLPPVRLLLADLPPLFRLTKVGVGLIFRQTEQPPPFVITRHRSVPLKLPTHSCVPYLRFCWLVPPDLPHYLIALLLLDHSVPRRPDALVHARTHTHPFVHHATARTIPSASGTASPSSHFRYARFSIHPG